MRAQTSESCSIVFALYSFSLLFMSDKIHTARPNIYDYLKVIALISMIIDHIGFFFFPEYEILRVIGRLAFPLFLFLVGYNWSFRRRNSLRIYAIIIQFFIWSSYYLWYSSVYYLNILFVIGLVRFILSIVKDSTPILLFLFFIGLSCVSYTTDYADYGTLSLSFAILWYRAGKYKHHWFGYLVWWWVLMYYVWFMIENSWFDPSLYGGLVIVWIFLFVAWATLYRRNYSRKVSPRWDAFVSTFSQNALHIYFIHVVLFALLYWLLYLF